MTVSPLTLDSLPERGDSHIYNASTLRINIVQPFKSYYCHGWQSWSVTAWINSSHEIPVMKPTSFHSRQTDPVYARYQHPNGSWLGAVELAPDDILFLGALSLEAHVALRDCQLQGWYETGTGEWFLARGSESEVFTRFARLLEERFGKARGKKPPRVWCSWYSLYERINEENLLEVLTGLGDLPFDVFQIDDGWQRGPGDWEPNEKFPSGMETIAAKIKASGRIAGLWLAPLLVSKSSSIYIQRPDWLLRNTAGNLYRAGFEWSTETFAIDTTHPEAINWLQNLIHKVRGWGYDYLKLDFLYAGALPGRHYIDTPRETAFRQTLGVIREAAGNGYLLLCGTPILPSLGMCDAMRIGPDVGSWWDSRFYSYWLYNQTTPGLKNAIRTSVNRLWLSPLTNVDPDVAFFSEKKELTPQQRQLSRDLTEICGVKATSDLPDTWTEAEKSAVRSWLESSPAITRTGRYSYRVGEHEADFGPAMPLPPIPSYIDKLIGNILGLIGNQLWALKLWHWLFRNK